MSCHAYNIGDVVSLRLMAGRRHDDGHQISPAFAFVKYSSRESAQLAMEVCMMATISTPPIGHCLLLFVNYLTIALSSSLFLYHDNILQELNSAYVAGGVIRTQWARQNYHNGLLLSHMSVHHVYTLPYGYDCYHRCYH